MNINNYLRNFFVSFIKINISIRTWELHKIGGVALAYHPRVLLLEEIPQNTHTNKMGVVYVVFSTKSSENFGFSFPSVVNLTNSKQIVEKFTKFCSLQYKCHTKCPSIESSVVQTFFFWTKVY
jgi:hypothetical protein